MRINPSQAVLPRRLVAGDIIGVVAPSSPFDKASLDKGIEAIHQMGFGTRIDPQAYAGDGYLAGTDAERADQLNAMFGDPEVRAVMCARGGYGALRILDRLDYALMASYPKPLIGFSDATALHQAVYKRCGMATFHGPTVTTLGRSNQAGRRSWFQALTRVQMQSIAMPRADFLIPGVAEGVLVGGNLTVLSHLIGTPFWVPLNAKLLFIEEVGEAPYRIDRMLFQMKMAGLLEGLAGVVLGGFERCGQLGIIHQMARTFFEEQDIPVAAGLPMGHGHNNLTIALGALARLDSGSGELSFPDAILKE